MTETKDVPAWAKRLKSKWTAIGVIVTGALATASQFIEQLQELANALFSSL
ncbi:MAG: hypothetical protein AAF674_19705 [Pseudomonadota bacterium]